MKALIIGAAGFVGGHLITHLLGEGWEVVATKLPHEMCGILYMCNVQDVSMVDLDILNTAAIQLLLEQVQPDILFHLAAQSSVARSWESPALTVDVNIKGAVNLLEAIRAVQKPIRVLLIGSGEEYGPAVQMPINENDALRPTNIYALTKMAQGLMGQIYAKAYDLDIIVVRAFNHTGPGQSEQFVISSFCKQAAQIKEGLLPPEMQVGNLEAQRDFCDVRDIVRAYCLLAECGHRGTVYNVGSGRAVSIQTVLDTILSLIETNVTVTRDPARMRPSDTPLMMADIFRLTAHTQWKPQIPLETTLIDMLRYWTLEGREHK